MASQEVIAQLQEALALTPEITQHAEAKERFAALKAQITDEHPLAAEMLELVWNELIKARRSSAFWEQISDAEKTLTDQVGASYTNLQQNYLRLIQEQ